MIGPFNQLYRGDGGDICHFTSCGKFLFAKLYLNSQFIHVQDSLVFDMDYVSQVVSSKEF